MAERTLTDFPTNEISTLARKLKQSTAKSDTDTQQQEEAQPNHLIILDKIKELIPAIDFKKRLEIKENEKVSGKQYKITVIDVLIETAQNNKFDIGKKGGVLYIYNGAFWKLLDKEDLTTFLIQISLKMGVPEMTAKDVDFIKKLIEQFEMQTIIRPSKKRKGTTLVNLLNGTLVITEHGATLKPHDPNDFMTYQLGFEYNPKAEAPMFTKFINEVLPDKSLISVLAEYMGYVFMPNKLLKLEKVALLYGGGANGKSVFFEIIYALLGKENISSYSLQELTSSTNGNARALIANKLLNYASEINGKMETDMFKALASGEPVPARFLYKDSMMVEEYAKLLFNCNSLPKDVEHNEAFIRRWLIIHFSVTIPEERQDKQLSEKIISAELAGVFNWILQGLERILKQKNFTHSESVTDMVKKFKLESDSVCMFMDDEGYKPTSEGFIAQAELIAAYREYCKSNGYSPAGSKTIVERLKNNGYSFARNNIGKVVYASKNVF